MVLIQTLDFPIIPKITNSINVILDLLTAISEKSFIINSNSIPDTKVVLQLNTDIDNYSNIYQYTTTISNDVYIPVLSLFILQDYINILTIEDRSINECFAYLVVGDQYITPNLNTNFITANVVDKFKTDIEEHYVYQYITAIEYIGGNISQINSYLTLSTTLTQEDIKGPQLQNIFPAPYSTFNNTLTNVGFNIVDLESTTINQSSLYIYINDVILVSGGNITCPPASGTVSLTQQTDYRYIFLYTPLVGFSSDYAITISGKVEDNYYVSSGNLTNFNYWFKVWKTSDLGATIFALPDVQSPYLLDLDPYSGQNQVGPNISPVLTIKDDHTGVLLNSIILKMDGNVIFSGLENILPDYANVTYINSHNNLGVDLTINPIDSYDFNKEVNIEVYATDKYTLNPNILNTSYNFKTIDNTHLIVEDFLIEIDGNYIPCNLTISYPISYTGINYSIIYSNLTGSGIDINNSKIYINDQEISFVYTSISGNNSYRLNFMDIPDYTKDCNIEFKVVQLAPFLGETVDIIYKTKLLYGAEFCYNPDSNFTYNTELPIVMLASDYGYKETVSTNSYTVKTEYNPYSNLNAEIIAKPDNQSIIKSHITALSPYFSYGKTMNLTLIAEDYSGNKLEYSWQFTIESKNY